MSLSSLLPALVGVGRFQLSGPEIQTLKNDSIKIGMVDLGEGDLRS